MSADNEWLSATGPVPIRMTNDYLFRALLQRSDSALKGLICSLLHLNADEIVSVAIMNPIELGKTFASKDFFLDIKVSLNNRMVVHLEMQVINQYNWTDRSLSYLCRTFDELETGEGYRQTKPVIQIGLLDYTLFPECPEFYATYEFRNAKNNHLYSDKLRLCVLDLNRIDLATKEDRHHKIDYWASLFKSTTWEEIKMLAKDNACINDAASTIYRLSQEETIRLQCEARDDYYRTQLDIQYEMEQRDTQLAKKNSIIKKQDVTLKDITAENKSLIAKNEALAADNEKLLTWALEHGYQPE